VATALAPLTAVNGVMGAEAVTRTGERDNAPEPLRFAGRVHGFEGAQTLPPADTLRDLG